MERPDGERQQPEKHENPSHKDAMTIDWML